MELWVQEKSLTAMVKAETMQIVVTAKDMLLVAWTGQQSLCYLPSKQTAGTMPVHLAEKALLADTGLDVAELLGDLEQVAPGNLYAMNIGKPEDMAICTKAPKGLVRGQWVPLSAFLDAADPKAKSWLKIRKGGMTAEALAYLHEHAAGAKSAVPVSMVGSMLYRDDHPG